MTHDRSLLLRTGWSINHRVRIVTLTLLTVCSQSLLADDQWLAVGYGGRRMISDDGLNWKITAEWVQPGGDDGNNLMSAVHAEEKYVVVGGGGSGQNGEGHILVSHDGLEWNQVFTSKSRINPVAHGDGRFVVGVSRYPSGRLMFSDDAQSWTEGAAIEMKGLTHFRQGAFGNGVFVLVGNAGGRGGRSWAVVTPDGESITSERDDLPGHGTLVFGGGRFVMMTSNSKADLIASTDGVAWERLNLGNDARLSWLVWSGEEFIAGDGRTAWRSRGGREWTSQPLKAQGRIAWSDGDRFISTSWPGKMAWSPDGERWQRSPELTANGINRVVHRADP